MGDDGTEHPLLAAEAVTDQRARASGPPPDLDQRRPLIALFGEQFRRRLDHALAGLLAPLRVFPGAGGCFCAAHVNSHVISTGYHHNKIVVGQQQF
ncbi:hypothetical protein [Sneathiella sedimenti]|uniref:hypothetical protein n=1 Tax=Sneathiella sedimenti TaxID=2816034 RepID=UPI001F348D8B|nr:hypothetical protein [Sneathiella sedimenti]